MLKINLVQINYQCIVEERKTIYTIYLDNDSQTEMDTDTPQSLSDTEDMNIGVSNHTHTPLYKTLSRS